MSSTDALTQLEAAPNGGGQFRRDPLLEHPRQTDTDTLYRQWRGVQSVSEGRLEQLLHGRGRAHHRSRTVATGGLTAYSATRDVVSGASRDVDHVLVQVLIGGCMREIAAYALI
jgi:hypothetical protein